MPATVLTANDRLHDLILRRQVTAERMMTQTMRDVDRLWRDATRDIVRHVRRLIPVRTETRVGFGLQRYDRQVLVRQLVGEIAERLAAVSDRITDRLDRELGDAIEYQLLTLPRAITAFFDREVSRALAEAILIEEEVMSVTFDSVPVGQVRELLTSVVGGARFMDAFGDLTATVLRALRTVLVSGLIVGDDTRQVTTRVQNVLRNKRYEAERIVRSEYIRAGNQAALLTYQQNDRYLKAVQWSATLDKRTCVQCGLLDGKTWSDPRKARIPVTSTHPNCRCALVPVVKSAKELGLPSTPGTRASFNGQVPSTVTYKDWFGRQSSEFQRDVLGPTRYDLYQSGRLALTDFVTPRGIVPVSRALDLARRRN